MSKFLSPKVSLLLVIMGEQKCDLSCGFKLELIATYYLKFFMKVLLKYYRHNIFLFFMHKFYHKNLKFKHVVGDIIIIFITKMI